jgi:hypothetical protein
MEKKIIVEQRINGWKGLEKVKESRTEDEGKNTKREKELRN